MSCRISLPMLALAAVLAACDRPVPTASDDRASPGAVISPSLRSQSERAGMDRLARRLARALADPAFRQSLKGELDRSPFPEHKLQLQSFLGTSGRRALKQLARLNAVPESELQAEANEAIPLEFYFPVPAHRAAWSGGPDILVASAREDHEAPVAYDVAGRRQVLDPDRPPSTPVLAVVPVETDFAQSRKPAWAVCTEACGGGDGSGGTVPPPAGLYLTYSHIVQDFEGWLKGSPEFEIHVLGQSGTSDSLMDYQCAGQAAGGYYHFDQNDLNWNGSALLFTQAQLNAYRLAHPNQNFRIIALEDDDTGCVIKFDADRFKNVLATIQSQYPNLTGTKDTTSSTLVKYAKRANALQKILRQVYSLITTPDDLIGNAVEDVVVGQTYPGANWILKGERNLTNGWLKLEMR
jgi:hypothetical protein